VYTVATAIYPDSEFSPGDAPDDDREPVRIMSSQSRLSEAVQVLNEATRLAKPGSPSAILLPSKSHMENFLLDIATVSSWSAMPPMEDSEDWNDPFGAANRYFTKKKSPLQLFGSKSGSITDSDLKKTVYLMTYYNAKGLEFPYVFLPHMTAETSLEAMKNATIEAESRIFFVAATRAKERLFLSYHGDPHYFIDSLRELDEDTITEFDPGKRRY
jgi:superfamily I DNA/RNA helicase